MGERGKYLLEYCAAGVRHVLKRPEDLTQDAEHYLDREQANQLIYERLQSGEPFLACRFGSGEMLTFLKTIEVRLGLRESIPEGNMDSMCVNAGFFPREQRAVMRFGEVMEEACRLVDLLGIWTTIPLEPYLLRSRLNHANWCKLGSLEPFFADNPWTRGLEGKKVLVIHPFEKTIRSQYKKREGLFPGRNILPEFELETLKAVQTIAGEKDERFQNWFEALDYMYQEALKKEFDVALIGCGAYGMPLAARLKTAGKQAIHLGGATQLLFGIRGKRWEQRPEFAVLMNECWCRPAAEETPQSASKVENSCYW